MLLATTRVAAAAIPTQYTQKLEGKDVTSETKQTDSHALEVGTLNNQHQRQAGKQASLLSLVNCQLKKKG